MIRVSNAAYSKRPMRFARRHKLKRSQVVADGLRLVMQNAKAS
jgi:hypothetical protein